MHTHFENRTETFKYAKQLFSELLYHILRAVGLITCVGCGKSLYTLCPKCAGEVLLFSPHCLYCEGYKALGNTHQSCRTGPKPIDHTIICYRYGRVIKRLFKKFKYAHGWQYFRVVQGLMSAYFKNDPFSLLEKIFSNKTAKIVIIPIPMHENKLRERGFSPALMIANHLLACLTEIGYTNLNLETKLLRKRRETQAQAGKSKRARLLNQLDVYEIVDKGKVPKQREKPAYIILVDDIISSGATIISACETLTSVSSFTRSKMVAFSFARG